MTETKAITVRYISKILFLKIVRKASYTKEVDGRIVHVPGDSIRFQDGVYETTDPAVVEFLESSKEMFGKVYIRVPDNVAALAHRANSLKSLEEREAEVAKREAEIAAKEAKSKAGAEVIGPKEPTDDLDSLKRNDLLEILKVEEVPGGEELNRVGVKNTAIIDAIRNNRLAKAKPEGSAY